MKEVLLSNRKRVIKYMLFSGMITIALITVSVIRAQGIFFPTDEFGYWDNAARILGTDWTTVTGGVNNYAKGYSVLLIPIMAICKNPVGMYKTALMLNALLVVLSSFLFIRLIYDLFGEFTFWVLPCLIFPSFLIYMSYTISEVFLYVLFLALCRTMVRISRDERKSWHICVGVLLSVLMVFVHYRTVGIAIIFAVVCLLTLRKKTTSDKRILFISISVLCILLITMILYSFTGGRISTKEFTPGSLIDFPLQTAGKIFYLGASTFGLGIIGLISAFRRRDDLFRLFFLLSFVYMIMLGSFFFYGGTRLDQLVYGRYEELFIPLFMYIGATEVCNGGEKNEMKGRPSWMHVTIFMGITALVLTLYVTYTGKAEYVADFVTGIDWLFGNKMPKISVVYIGPFLVTAAVLYVLDILMQKENKRYICMICLTGFFLFSATFLSWKHVWNYQDMDISDRQLAESALALTDEGRDLIFLNSPYNDYVNLLQFWFGDKSINMIEGLDPEAFQTPQDAVVVTYKNYERDDQLTGRYSDRLSSAHFVMYSNTLQ